MKPVPLSRVHAYAVTRHNLSWSRAWAVDRVPAEVPGIYGSAPTCYLSLAARSPSFDRGRLDDALYGRRTLGRVPAMRNTVFLLPTRLTAPALQAFRGNLTGAFAWLLKRSGISKAVYEQLAAGLRTVLADGPMTASEIRKRLPEGILLPQRSLGVALAALCADGRLIRSGVRGSWKSNLYEYALMGQWLPGVDLDAVTPHEARATLAGLYFRAYGPASLEDLQWWTGLTHKDTQIVHNNLRAQLAEVRVEGVHGDFFVHRSELDSLGAARLREPVAALLPAWDALLMGYRDRRRFLAPESHNHVYDRGGNAAPTLIVDGVAAGTWDTAERGQTAVIRIALFEEQGWEDWGLFRRAARRLGSVLGGTDLSVERCELPEPLTARPQGAFLSPLKGVTGEPVTG